MQSQSFPQDPPTEPFGMSVLETMAAECVPLVPRDGGPWFDILEEKEDGHGFSNESILKAAEKVRMLLENDELRTELSARARRRAIGFDRSVLESKTLSVAKQVYSKVSINIFNL